MTRRYFSRAFLALFGAGFYYRPKGLVYEVSFQVDLSQRSEREFFAMQSQFEDNDAIDRLSADFMRQGLLLENRQFTRAKNSLTWTYRFQDQSAFQKWEQALYKNGIVQQHGRPYTIHRQADYRFV